MKRAGLFGIPFLLSCTTQVIALYTDGGPPEVEGGGGSMTTSSLSDVVGTGGRAGGGGKGGGGGAGAGGAAVATGGAGGGDAGSGAPDGASVSTTVTGTVIDTFINDEGEVKVPRNLLGVPINAYFDTGAGTFIARTGAGTATGTFTIQEVPEGAYYVRIGSEYTLTTSRQPALGTEKLGRPDAVPVTMPSPVVYNVSGLDPWTSDDMLELMCFHNGSFDLLMDGLFLDHGPSAGATSLMGATGDMSLLGGNSLIDKDRNDAAFFVQLSSKMAGTSPYLTLTRAVRVDQLKQVDGQPLAFNGTMTPVTQTAAHLDFRVSEFAQYLGSIHPAATALVMPGATFVTSPGLTRPGGVQRGAELAALNAATSDDLVADITLGNPFPPIWGVALVADLSASVQFALPGTTPWRQYGVVRTTRVADPAGTEPIRPLLSPIVAPKFNTTIDAFADSTVPDPMPVLSWTAPRLGTATSYKIFLKEVTNVGGKTRMSDVASFDAGSATRVRFPPGVMERGRHYEARLLASTGTAPPQGLSNVLTGIFTVAP